MLRSVWWEISAPAVTRPHQQLFLSDIHMGPDGAW
jgi:hypothetical protein